MTMTFTILTGAKGTDGSIRNWVNNTLIPSTTILTEAEAYIYQRLRIREMIDVDTTKSLSASGQTITLPDGYREPIYVGFTGTEATTLKHRLPEDIELAATYDGTGVLTQAKPRYFYERGSQMQFDTPSDRVLTLRIVYFRALTALSAQNETNVLTDRYPRMLRSACLGMANEWMKDDSERDRWLLICQQEIDKANSEYEAMKMKWLDPVVIAG